MGHQAARRLFLRNLWWSTLFGFAVTFAGAFAARYSTRALLLLPYGIDDPFAPLFAVIRNSFWILVVLVVVSMFRSRQNAPTAAWPIFLVNLQVFSGMIIFVLLATMWHHFRLPDESSASTLLGLAFTGQLLAHVGRVKLTKSMRRQI